MSACEKIIWRTTNEDVDISSRIFFLCTFGRRVNQRDSLPALRGQFSPTGNGKRIDETLVFRRRDNPFFKNKKRIFVSYKITVAPLVSEILNLFLKICNPVDTLVYFEHDDTCFPSESCYAHVQTVSTWISGQGHTSFSLPFHKLIEVKFNFREETVESPCLIKFQRSTS